MFWAPRAARRGADLLAATALCPVRVEHVAAEMLRRSPNPCKNCGESRTPHTPWNRTGSPRGSPTVAPSRMTTRPRITVIIGHPLTGIP